MSDGVVNYCTSVSFNDVMSNVISLKLCAFCSAQRQKWFVIESVLFVRLCSSVKVSLCVLIWTVKYKVKGRIILLVSTSSVESDLILFVLVRNVFWKVMQTITCYMSRVGKKRMCHRSGFLNLLELEAHLWLSKHFWEPHSQINDKKIMSWPINGKKRRGCDRISPHLTHCAFS